MELGSRNSILMNGCGHRCSFLRESPSLEFGLEESQEVRVRRTSGVIFELSVMPPDSVNYRVWILLLSESLNEEITCIQYIH